MNESSGDFQQGDCLYKLLVSFNAFPKPKGHLTGLRKSGPVHFWQWCCDN